LKPFVCVGPVVSHFRHCLRRFFSMVGGPKTNSSMATATAIVSWFLLNIAIGSSTKWIFLYGKVCSAHQPDECQTFKFPLTITIIHMLFSWGMCFVQLHLIRGTGPGRTFTVSEQFYKIAPLSASFSLSVGMGNLSLKYIFPSFNQMLGSMTPLITVLLAVALYRKSFNGWTWASMPIICGGLALCSITEVNFHALGAFFASSATVLRALKSILQGKLLQGEKVDSVTLLYYMAPWAAVMLSAVAVFSEGVDPLRMLARGLPGVSSWWSPEERLVGSGTLLLMLAVSGLNACLLNVVNFSVTAYTSPVTLQVLGNVKNCLSILVSVSVFGNTLQGIQGVGVAICLLGVWVYNTRGGAAKKVEAQSAKTQEKVVKLAMPEGQAPPLASRAMAARRAFSPSRRPEAVVVG